MRSLVLAFLIFSSVPFALLRPVIGLYVYSLVSYMNPNRLTWGFAENFPFAMIMGAVTVAAWLWNKDEPKKLPMTAGTVLILVMTVWITITTFFFALDPGPAHVMWLRVIKILFITILTIIMINSRERLNGLIWIIVFSIGFFAVKGGIFSFLTGGHDRVWGPPSSMIADNNSLAVATIMIVPLARYLQLASTKKWVRIGLIVCMPIMIFSALSSYSRGALLAIGVMGGFMWMKSRRKALLGIAIVAVAVAGLSFMPERWFHRMQTMETYTKDQSAMGRINAWHFAYNFTKDHPIFGGGMLVFNVNSLWSKYAPDPTNPLNAHSIYFQVMAEQGFGGLLIFLACFIVAFRNGSWVIRQTKSRPELSWARDMASLMQVSLIGYAVGGAFLDLPYYDLPWHLAAMLLICRFIVQREIIQAFVTERPVSDNTAPSSTNRLSKTSAYRPSFLRKATSSATQSQSYLRRSGARPDR